MIGPPSAVAGKVLSHHPLAVALVTLHLEWMTQRHYVESIREDREIDPLFMSLLKHHWMEEAQHAKIDMLIVEALASQCSRQEAEQAAEEYLEIGAFLELPGSSSRPNSTSTALNGRPDAPSAWPSARPTSAFSVRRCAGPIWGPA